MRRIKRWIGTLACLMALMLMSCADQDIPVNSQHFIKQYFPGTSVVLVEIDDDDDDSEMEYCVWLNDGTKVEFNMQGEWERVGRKKTGVPVKLMPPAIIQYVRANYPDDVVSKLSKKPYGYKIELSNDKDLRFNPQGQFMEVID